MANIVIKVITVHTPESMTDSALARKLTQAVSKKRKEVSNSKKGGVFQNCNIYRVLKGKPRHKIYLTFLVYSDHI